MSVCHDNLPPQLTPFIGREAEIDVLAAILADASCRLVTVLGPGGIGKTRFAIALASRIVAKANPNDPAFADGVWFVALQAVVSAEYLVSTIADALQCPPPGAADPRAHLLAYLRNKQLLLVLDNFEHLRDGAELLTVILTAAPDVKLLATSREALNVQEEWRYPLGGLDLPWGDQASAPEQTSAMRLFVERARRVRPDFDLVAERDAAARICRQVEGMPLAIELAATWTRTLPCAVIASEMESNLAFLSSSLHNVPERHRSMRAAFDRSWDLLNEGERAVLAQLSVFHGSFQRQAAESISGAPLQILSGLVDKSLLRWEPGDRYQIHALLRQYAEEHLEQSPIEAARVHDRHCAYYADFLKQRAEDLNGRRQREALAEIGAEIENARAAWQHALEHGRVADIQRAAYTFYLFHDYQSRYREGADIFERAAQSLSGEELTIQIGPVLSELLLCLGWLSIRLGQLQQARAVLERSQAILDRLNVPPRPGPGTDPRTALGTLACVLGHYQEAAMLGEQARQLGEACADQGNLMYAYFVLTNAAFAQGHYEAAQRYATQACALADELHDRWFLAYLLGDMGHVARALGDYANARRHYQASYAIRQEFGDPEGMAVALSHLGQIALLQGESAEADTLFQQSQTIYRAIGDRGGTAMALHGLGMAACAAGAYTSAAQHLHEALRIAAAIDYAPRTYAILTGVAELLLLTGRLDWATELLVVIVRHPATDRETGDRARNLLLACETYLSPDVFATATHARQMADLDVVLARVRVAFGLEEQGSRAESDATTVASMPVRATTPMPPVDSLTEREIAVLRLIADGKSNQDIADRLIISHGTAKWYVSQIFGKLDVHSRTQAVMRARALGILS